MAYILTLADSTPTHALRRIARAELAGALSLAQGGGVQSPLHDMRKHIKKTRALLRLVAPHFEDWRAADTVLRATARRISGMRDTEVICATLDRLATDSVDTSAASACVAMRATLGCPNIAQDRTATQMFIRDVKALRASAKHWNVDAKGWNGYGDGLAHSLEQGAARLKKAHRTGAECDLHALRSRVKQHWYHARLMAQIWPEMLAPQIACADRLGEMLGEHHDLCLLGAALPEALDAARAKPLAAVIDARKTRLEVEGYALADRLFSEDPASLARRWGGWYALWRKG